MYKLFFKRVLDIVISFVALLLIGWLLVFIAIFLHFANKGSGAFFLQERPGKDEKIFKVIKFKTMTDECDADGNLLPDAQRLTRVGRFVRASFWIDLVIVFKTIIKVLTRKDINNEASATMYPFDGTN